MSGDGDFFLAMDASNNLGINFVVGGAPAAAAAAQGVAQGLANIRKEAKDAGLYLDNALRNIERLSAARAKQQSASGSKIDDFLSKAGDAEFARREAQLGAMNDRAMSLKANLREVMGAQSQGGGGNILAGAARFGPAAAAVAAGIGFAKNGVDNLAETEQAQSTLVKLGSATDELAGKMEIVEKLKFITGDKISAANLLQKALNGSTGELKRMGIEISDTATATERLAAVQQLAERGAQTQALETQTLSGAWKNLKSSVGDTTEGIASWVNETFGVRDVLLNISDVLKGDWLGEGFAKRGAEMAKAKKSLEEQGNAARVAAGAEQMLAAENAKAEAATKATKKAVDDLTASLAAQKTATDNAANAMAALAEAETAVRDARIDVAVAKGEMTMPDAQRAKARNEFDKRDAQLAQQEEALKAEKARLDAELAKARTITRPTDVQDAALNGNADAQRRIDQRTQIEAVLNQQLEANRNQNAILQQQKALLDEQLRLANIEANAADRAAGAGLAADVAMGAGGLLDKAKAAAGRAIEKGNKVAEKAAEQAGEAARDYFSADEPAGSKSGVDDGISPRTGRRLIRSKPTTPRKSGLDELKQRQNAPIGGQADTAAASAAQQLAQQTAAMSQAVASNITQAAAQMTALIAQVNAATAKAASNARTAGQG